MTLPPWLNELRSTEIVRTVQADARTRSDHLLGVPKARIFHEVLGGGQADFDSPWQELSSDDRALLYAYFLQKPHIEELMAAFTMLFANSSIEDPVVIDLGCGPFTGGLALGAVLGTNAPYSYIGVDRSAAMRRLGEQLASAAVRTGGIANAARHWVDDLDSVQWTSPPKWRPVIVIVSYLLASPTLDACALVAQVEKLLLRLGRGPVTVIYTNSPRPDANRSFPSFRAALEAAGFTLNQHDTGKIQIERSGSMQDRELQYALFHRQTQNILHLAGG